MMLKRIATLLCSFSLSLSCLSKAYAQGVTLAEIEASNKLHLFYVVNLNEEGRIANCPPCLEYGRNIVLPLSEKYNMPIFLEKFEAHSQTIQEQGYDSIPFLIVRRGNKEIAHFGVVRRSLRQQPGAPLAKNDLYSEKEIRAAQRPDLASYEEMDKALGSIVEKPNLPSPKDCLGFYIDAQFAATERALNKETIRAKKPKGETFDKLMESIEKNTTKFDTALEKLQSGCFVKAEDEELAQNCLKNFNRLMDLHVEQAVQKARYDAQFTPFKSKDYERAFSVDTRKEIMQTEREMQVPCFGYRPIGTSKK